MFLMQVRKDLLSISAGVQFRGEWIVKQIEEAAALLAMGVLVAIIMLWALDYAIGLPH